MRPRVFVGSSAEAIAVCRAVQAELENDLEVTVWDQDVFRPTYGALDSLLEALDSSHAGIFILRPDDLTTSRGEANQTVRDNVIFELGMFIRRSPASHDRDRGDQVRRDHAAAYGKIVESRRRGKLGSSSPSRR